jgi:hypothetical protein
LPRAVRSDRNAVIRSKFEKPDISENPNAVPVARSSEHRLIILVLVDLAVLAMKPTAFQSTLFVHHPVVLVQDEPLH